MNFNVGQLLTEFALQRPDDPAVVETNGHDYEGKRLYRALSFRELNEDSDRLAAGIQRLGAPRGARLALMVRPGIDFVSLVFAMFKSGVVTVLIDPGMGRRNMIRCLKEVEPEGFVAIPPAHAVRSVLRFSFPRAKYNVTVGRRWFWGGATVARMRRRPATDFAPFHADAHDPAAIIFTSGSTGPAKGVLYRHGNFWHQVSEIRDRYHIKPGEVDLPSFPLFALFSAAMGVTTVIPDMDFTRPANVDPAMFVELARDWKATQAFGSPALWNVVGRYCERNRVRIPSLRRAMSAGAPVPPHVLRRIKQAMPDEGEMHTPYGATESLPVASTSASEVLGETAVATAEGAGTCVGKKFARIDWKVIRISDEPIATLDQVEELPCGEIGEIIVRGPVVTTEYVTRRDANALHKIQDGETFWHRIGDVGYFDDQDRFWYCGRKSQRVRTATGTLFTDPCEAIIQRDQRIYRAALVGVGHPGQQTPVIIAEPWSEHYPHTTAAKNELLADLRSLAEQFPATREIRHFLLHQSLPVDIRHNSKIFREQLAVWAASRVQLQNAK